MRGRILFVFFVCWGMIILSSGPWLILKKREPLLKFAAKTASRTITFHPLRAPILDCNGEKIAWSEWQFYISAPMRRRNDIQKISRELDLFSEPLENAEKKELRQNIPAKKLADAVRLVKKYRLRIAKNIIRKYIDLPYNSKYYIGDVLLHYGVYGLEREFDRQLQGRAAVYSVMRSSRSGTIDRKSFKIITPLQEGSALKVPYSLTELQSGLLLPGGFR